MQRAAGKATRRIFVLIVAAALLASACDWHLKEIPGDGPVRYRDELFAFERVDDLVYGNAHDYEGAPVDLALDLYQPVGDEVLARPAVIWVHGGHFSRGHKRMANVRDLSRSFARRGYVAVSINYRLHPDGCAADTPTETCVETIRNAMHDAQAAARWLRANAETYSIDPNRIAIGGVSAGAITALNVGYRSEEPGDSGNPGFSSHVTASVSISGAALYPPKPGDAQALFFHGSEDTIVPFSWMQDTVAKATAAGLVANSTVWETGHDLTGPYLEEITAQTTNFLYWNLYLEGAAQ